MQEKTSQVNVKLVYKYTVFKIILFFDKLRAMN